MEETADLIGELSDYSDDTNEEGNCDFDHIKPISPIVSISFFFDIKTILQLQLNRLNVTKKPNNQNPNTHLVN